MNDPHVRLLVVEGNPADARLVELALLEAEGLPVDITRVGTLVEARLALAAQPFDLILLDLDLPDSQGTATLQGITAAAAGLPILVFTERGLENTALEILRAGADDVLRKEAIGGGALVRSVRHALERQRRSRHEHFLAGVFSVIGGSLDAEAALRTLAHLAVPGLADWCLIELVEPGREVRVLEIVAADPRKQALLRAKLSSYPHATGGGQHPVDRVLRTGRPQLIEHVAEEELQRMGRDAQHLRLLRELDPRSMMVLPLTGSGSVLGAVTLTASESGRIYDAAELRLAEKVVEPIAALVRNVRQMRRAEDARRTAERTAERSGYMERIASALAGALTPEQVAAAMMTEGMPFVGARAGAFLLLNQGSTALELTRAVGIPEAHLPLLQGLSTEGASPLSEALRSGTLQAMETREELVARYPEFAEGAGRWVTGGLLALPLAVDGRTLGVIAFELERLEPLSAEDVALYEACANRCARAFDRATLYAREQRALAEAEQASRIKDEVLSVVAHDLRNPLSAAAMYAELLEQQEVAPEQRREWSRAIHGLTEQMQRLVGDLLDATRLESGTLVLEPVPVQAAALIDDAMSLMEPVSRAAGITLRVEPLSALPDVRADLKRIRQVFSNLLGNAIRFSPPSGEVRLRAERLGSEVLFLVSDDGPGIPLEHRPRVFDRLWQGKRGGAGAGLGLAIAKGIVDLHGGRIGVESRPGAGSTFFFSLPCAAPDPPVPAADPSPREASTAPRSEGSTGTRPPPSAPVRVLVVDDHPLIRRGVRAQLEHTGRYTVVAEAATGEEAVRFAQLARPQIVLMDLHLPGLSGIEATRRITAELPDLPVLALSGEAEDDVLLEVLEAGASGFVRKATAEHDLIPALETVLQGEVFLYPSGNRLLLRDFLQLAATAPNGPAEALTDHERQVLALSAEGYTSSEIGRKLFFSPQTVDSYRSRAMRKLGLSGRPALVRYAVETGLLAHRD